MQACQKDSLENNHEELRYILPKEVKDLRAIGFTRQYKLNVILDNTNSSPIESRGGKLLLNSFSSFFLTYSKS
jgi:hypothetical protein